MTEQELYNPIDLTIQKNGTNGKHGSCHFLVILKFSLAAILKDPPLAGEWTVTLLRSVSSLAHGSLWYLILTSD